MFVPTVEMRPRVSAIFFFLQNVDWRDHGFDLVRNRPVAGCLRPSLFSDNF